MEITKRSVNGVHIAVIQSKNKLITDVQSALDLMATVRYEADCDRIMIRKSAISEEFFDLKTRLAGDILEKFVNYHIKIAIIGDFSAYTSKSLKDFIYECNKGRHIFFLPNEEEAIKKLSTV